MDYTLDETIGITQETQNYEKMAQIANIPAPTSLTEQRAKTDPLEGLEELDDSEDVAHADVLKHQAKYIPQVILKNGDAFLITDVAGNLLDTHAEMGLFWHGTRFLRTCNLTLEGLPLVTLSHHVSTMSDSCQIDATNAELHLDHDTRIEKGTIHIRRLLELHPDQLVQTFTITNFYATAIAITCSLHLEADYCDMFDVRGFPRTHFGTRRPTRMSHTEVVAGYQGADGVTRETHISLTPPAHHIRYERVSWHLSLPKGQPVEVRIVISPSSSNQERFVTGSARGVLTSTLPTITSSDPLFDQFLTRGMQDLGMLSTMTPYGLFPYAGIPWFSCPFGRDGLITCLEFLPWFPQVVRGTLALLAAHQGTKTVAFTDEQPGKILHEYRQGELANLREIPYLPYYGTIDATPLFLIVLGEYMRWTNDTTLLEQLWPHAQAAAQWMQTYADKDGDGFLEYTNTSDKGLVNQGWKDAWDSVSHADGRLAHAPIALCEVQSYAYAAYRAMGYLARRRGEDSAHWEHLASTLQQRFLDAFWWDEEQTLYLALDGDKQPCAVVSSNAGQCLWSGILPSTYAEKLITRLLQDDMNSGWGIRTLSMFASRYNPMSYHNGSVWPHDTAIIGDGMARHGEKSAASTLLRNLYDAARHFDGLRLPELYCGFTRRAGYGPTRYPVACSPQAWAAGAPFLLLNGMLGLEPDAEHQRLTLNTPKLPDWLSTLRIQGIQVGGKEVSLRLLRVDEHTDVIIEDDTEVDVITHIM